MSNSLTVTEFVEGDHKDFSVVNSKRQIPTMIDGLKPSQRKILFSAIEYGKEELVDRLAMYSAARTAYKSGGDNLSDAITNMARAFPGTNNIPYFDRDGQFGSIMSDKASSSRYISVKVSKLVSLIFKKEDNGILDYNYLGDEQLEPKFFLPVLPMILINGSDGIGSAYASKIYNHSVKSVITALKCLLRGDEPTPLQPYWEGFTGESGYTEEGRVYAVGKFSRINATTIHITEVPVGYFSKTYETKVLLPLYKAGVITDISNNTNEIDGWNITVQFKRGELSSKTDEEVTNLLKLSSARMPTIVAWDENGYIRSYENVQQILVDFFNYRLSRYEDRRLQLIEDIRAKMAVLDKQRMFVYFISQTDLNQDISKLKAYFLENYKLYHIRDTISLHCDSLEMTTEDVDNMFKISLSSITKDARERLSSRLDVLLQQLLELQKLSDIDLYMADIELIEKEMGL